MPYNPAKSRELLQVAQAYSSSPQGEYIGQLAQQLVDAEAEIKLANVRANKAETDLSRAEQERDTALTTARRLRDGNAGQKEMHDALTVIAKNPKGAAKIASAALAAAGGGA